MTLFQNKYRVESARLPNWDYSTPGYYFVTICAYNHRCIFGDIVNDNMRLNEYGKIVSDCVNQIPGHFDNAEMDEKMVMPNHVHAIIRLLDSVHSRNPRIDIVTPRVVTPRRDVACNVSTGEIRDTGEIHNTGNAGEIRNVNTKIPGTTKNTVAPTGMRDIHGDDDTQNRMSRISPKPESLSTIVRSFKSAVTNRMHAAQFKGVVWQPRFHDHIIRNIRELYAIRRYIRSNPANWKNDRNVIETTTPNSGKQPWFIFMG
jgi:putative transposase